MDKPNNPEGRPVRTAKSRWIALLVVGAIIAYPIVNMCRFTGVCSVDGIKWIWYMTHPDEYGRNGMHLEPGREYYIPEFASTFVVDYYPVKPVSAEIAELNELVSIGVVRPDQKIAHEVDYKRIRTPYTLKETPAELGVVVNGDYFFAISDVGVLGQRVTIDSALRASSYLKISVYLQKVTAAEKVDRIVEWHNDFMYWDTTGNRKESVGYRIENGKRTDWRNCFAESDGDHAPCPNGSK